MKGNLGLKTYGFSYTHTDSQLILVISMVALMVGTMVALMVGTVVCVLLPDIWVLFFWGSVGGDHSWIDLSCHQRPSLNTHQLVHSQGFLA